MSTVQPSCRLPSFWATDRRKYERELLLARRRAEELLVSEREAQQARTLAEERLRLALDSAHGGRVRVMSTEADGTSFVVLLPRQPSA
jgi:hypothetical protein